jgi:hypothetical protein
MILLTVLGLDDGDEGNGNVYSVRVHDDVPDDIQIQTHQASMTMRLLLPF